jgi:hypothetical protein
MKVYGIFSLGTAPRRSKALKELAAEHLQDHTLVMVGDFLTATARALEDVARGDAVAVGGCLDDIALPAAHDGFGRVEWAESWLAYLKEHGVAFLAIPSAMAPDSTSATTASIIRGYNRAAEVLAAEIRKLQAEQRRGERAASGGYICGRPPYGYQVVKGAFVINQAQAETVKYIFKARRAGTTINEMLVQLKLSHSGGGIIPGKPQFWDGVKVRRILKHARMYCLGQYDGGRGQPLQVPSLAFLPAKWVDTVPQLPTPPIAALAAS